MVSDELLTQTPLIHLMLGSLIELSNGGHDCEDEGTELVEEEGEA